VHYYEDGNVRMSTSKSVEVASASGADAVVREIAKAENKFQEELNRAFVQLAEGSFKGLRRQLPVTRQRVEWEKIGGYRVCFSWKFCTWGSFADMDCSSARTLAVDARSRSWESVNLVHVMCLDNSWIFIDRPGIVQKCRMSLRVPLPVSCELLVLSNYAICFKRRPTPSSAEVKRLEELIVPNDQEMVQRYQLSHLV
jgi:hypothetical protein